MFRDAKKRKRWRATITHLLKGTAQRRGSFIRAAVFFFFSVNVLNPVFTSLIQIITPAVVAVVFNVVIDDGIGFFT